MQMTFDLGPDQSNRLIDRAIGHHAEVTLAPRGWSDDESLKVTIQDSDGGLLWVENSAESARSIQTLIGMHVDARMILGQTLYLFDTHVLNVDVTESRCLLVLARPESLQVTQRRRFQRMTLKSTCQVHLSWQRGEQDHSETGKLLNLSVDGMACRLAEHAAESLCVGGRVHAVFHPPEADGAFEFDAVLSNTSQAGSEGFVLLGLQFELDQADPRDQAARQRLTDFLYAPPRVLATQGDE